MNEEIKNKNLDIQNNENLELKKEENKAKEKNKKNEINLETRIIG
jgi:hypothetical protein